MRITCSDLYMAHDIIECDLTDCQRQYCQECRVLWRECETAIKTEDGAGQYWYELNDCPSCLKNEMTKRMRYANQG